MGRGELGSYCREGRVEKTAEKGEWRRSRGEAGGGAGGKAGEKLVVEQGRRGPRKLDL